jgi:hypothetical protein
LNINISLYAEAGGEMTEKNKIRGFSGVESEGWGDSGKAQRGNCYFAEAVFLELLDKKHWGSDAR